MTLALRESLNQNKELVLQKVLGVETGLKKMISKSVAWRVNFSFRPIIHSASFDWAPTKCGNCSCLFGTFYMSRATDINKTFRHGSNSFHYPLLTGCGIKQHSIQSIKLPGRCSQSADWSLPQCSAPPCPQLRYKLSKPIDVSGIIYCN